MRREFSVNLVNIGLGLMQNAKPASKMTPKRILSITTLSLLTARKCALAVATKPPERKETIRDHSFIP